MKTGKITMADLLRILPQTWAGNLIGSVVVALIYSYGGSLLPDAGSLVHKVALAKTQAPAMTLFMKGSSALAGLPRHLDGAAHRGCRQVHRDLVVPAGLYRLRLRALHRQHDPCSPLLVWRPPEAYTWSGIGHNLLWVTWAPSPAPFMASATGGMPPQGRAPGRGERDHHHCQPDQTA